MTFAMKPKDSEKFKVVEVQIAPPHERRVMAVDLTEQEANEFIKFAVMRRGVEAQFYVAEPFSDDEGAGMKPDEWTK